MRVRDLPRYAVVDEGNAADQNGTGPRAALICRIPFIHRPGSARPQVAYGEAALHIRIAGYEAHRIRVRVHRCSSVAMRPKAGIGGSHSAVAVCTMKCP